MKKNTDILNKLRYETENANVIHLWLEGMFWKAYERSAYLFVHRISGYKPYKKFVRAVGGEVVAIGFPAKSVERLLEGRSVEYVDEKHYILNGFTVDSRELRDFQTWKKGVPSFPFHVVEQGDNPVASDDVKQEKTEQIKKPEKPVKAERPAAKKPEMLPQPTACPPEVRELIIDIRRFRMESATPLECMMFLSQLIKKSIEIEYIT